MAKWFTAFLILVLFAGGAWTQGSPTSSTVKSSSGVVEFTLDFAGGTKKPAVSVNLEGPMIRIATAAAAEAAPPIGKLLEQIELIQVKVYEDLQQDATSVLHTAAMKIAELKQQGWSTVVSVPDDNETVDVLSRTSRDSILGLVVLVAEENELVFVNLAGEIDPEGLGQMLGKYKEGILKGEFDFEDFLSMNEGDDDKDNVKKDLKEKMKDRDTDKGKDPQPEVESSPK